MNVLPIRKRRARSSPGRPDSEANRCPPRDRIPRLLLKAGAITSEQFTYAERVRSKLTTARSLINVILELGFITEEKLREILVANQNSLRLGALLVELGHLREAHLEAAIEVQNKSDGVRKLGEVLLDLNMIDAAKVVDILSVQLGFPVVKPEPSEIDTRLLETASVSWYLTHQFIPVCETSGTVTVAFVDPLDPSSRRAAEQVFGLHIHPAITTKQGLMEALLVLDDKVGDQTYGSADQDAVKIVSAMLDAAVEDQVSDVHIEPMQRCLRIRFRRDGRMLLYKELSRGLASSIVNRIKVLASIDISEKRRHQGGRILYKPSRLSLAFEIRASSYVTIHGENIVLRILNNRAQLLGLGQLGLAPNILERFRDEALDVPSGVVIATGPTGSGKTTTLYSAVSYLNRPEISIITAEDPVEYAIEGVCQCTIKPKLEITYEETLRHIVRQDPDVIVLGEIRDKFSAEAAIQAALTGHKVLTTFHTEDSIGGLLRLMTMEIETFLISTTVVSVVAQRLLRKVCTHCAEPYAPTPRELHSLGYTNGELNGARLLIGKGCKRCRYTGYRGRIGVFELLVLNESVRQAILDRRTSHEIRRLAIEDSGLMTLVEDGVTKAAAGITSLPEVVRRLPRMTNPRTLSELARIRGE